MGAVCAGEVGIGILYVCVEVVPHADRAMSANNAMIIVGIFFMVSVSFDGCGFYDLGFGLWGCW